MATDIKMPQLSDTMNAGKILSWKKKEGDTVKRGDVLAEVETEKANLEIECFSPGVLLKIVVPAGATAKVGDAIAMVGQPGESTGTVVQTSTTPQPSSAPPPPAHSPSPLPNQSQSITTTPLASATGSDGNRIKASPLARKIAEDRQVDLTVVSGTGPGGRIVRRDVEAVGGNTAPQRVIPAESAPTPVCAPATLPPPAGSGKLTPLSKMRETIARRMQESVTTAPHFYLTTSIVMREASKLRETLKPRPEFKGISINHLVVKAAAVALHTVPRVNAAMRDGQLYEPAGINVGIITMVDDGLLIPVVHNADQLSLKDVVFETNAAIERARAGRPTAQDLSGGTFSISNMGMFDVENFTAIINPGQGAVLAVSSTREEAVVEHGQITIQPRMKVTLSVDHRIIDGVTGAKFLKSFKEALEVPALLM